MESVAILIAVAISFSLIYVFHKQNLTNHKMDRFIELGAELLSENRIIMNKLNVEDDSS
jgi:hypothetical protein